MNNTSYVIPHTWAPDRMGLAKFWLGRSFDTHKGYNVTVPGLNTIRIARPVPKDTRCGQGLVPYWLLGTT